MMMMKSNSDHEAIYTREESHDKTIVMVHFYVLLRRAFGKLQFSETSIRRQLRCAHLQRTALSNGDTTARAGEICF